MVLEALRRGGWSWFKAYLTLIDPLLRNKGQA